MLQIRQATLKDYLLTGVFLLGIFIIGYILERYQSISLLFSYSVIFVVYLVIIFNDKINNVCFYLAVAVILRLLLLFSLPSLSDDFYRFIWDGKLLSAGINPFSLLPVEVIKDPVIDIPGINNSLLDKLNSPEYYTIYPPVNQLIFWISVKMFPDSILGSVIIMRIFILLAEAGTLYLVYKILKLYQLPAKNILIYALNPLVILELTGNLHFEALMILFLLLSVYLLYQKRIIGGGIAFAFAIASKLIPVIFLPLFIHRLGLRRSAGFFLITGIITLTLFIPLLGTALYEGMSSSISLYFQKFEFNASIYYVVREIGYWIKGYNIIQTAGLYLAVVVFATVAGYTYWERNKSFNIFFSFIWVLFIYLIFATIVHPWYVIPLIAFSVFTRLRFPLVWSFVIFFTYTFYHQENVVEDLTIVFIEYMVVVIAILVDLKNNYKSEFQNIINLKQESKLFS